MPAKATYKVDLVHPMFLGIGEIQFALAEAFLGHLKLRNYERSMTHLIEEMQKRTGEKYRTVGDMDPLTEWHATLTGAERMALRKSLKAHDTSKVAKSLGAKHNPSERIYTTRVLDPKHRGWFAHYPSKGMRSGAWGSTEREAISALKAKSAQPITQRMARANPIKIGGRHLYEIEDRAGRPCGLYRGDSASEAMDKYRHAQKVAPMVDKPHGTKAVRISTPLDFEIERSKKRAYLGLKRNPKQKAYRVSFWPDANRDRRIRWIRYGTDMEQVFALTQKAARADYPHATGFSIESSQEGAVNLSRSNPKHRRGSLTHARSQAKAGLERMPFGSRAVIGHWLDNNTYEAKFGGGMNWAHERFLPIEMWTTTPRLRGPGRKFVRQDIKRVS
jgi:hypothetical protein